MNSNENLIIECLNELNKSALAKQKYKDYYEGNHSILKSYQMQDSRSNMRLVFNFPRKFVDNETGYILGKPVNYISKSDDSEIIAAIDKNTSHWDKEHNINLRKQSEIYGEAYDVAVRAPWRKSNHRQGRLATTLGLLSLATVFQF